MAVAFFFSKVYILCYLDFFSIFSIFVYFVLYFGILISFSKGFCSSYFPFFFFSLVLCLFQLSPSTHLLYSLPSFSFLTALAPRYLTHSKRGEYYPSLLSPPFLRLLLSGLITQPIDLSVTYSVSCHLVL